MRADLVVTCPKPLWIKWLAEGDCAGDEWTGQEYGWFFSDGMTRPPIGDLDETQVCETLGVRYWLPTEPQRLYVVAWGRLRGYAPITQLVYRDTGDRGQWVICREGIAVACTIDETIPGFRGWRRVWWDRAAEQPFPYWRKP